MARVPNGSTVYLDGVEMNFVKKFNVGDGWVECYTNSPSGYSNVDSESGEFMSSRFYGHIEVEFK